MSMASTFNTLLPNILVLRGKKRASTGFLCLNPMFIKKNPRSKHDPTT